MAFYSLKHYSFNYSFICGKFVENMAYSPHLHMSGWKGNKGPERDITFKIPEHVFVEVKQHV